jgi:hypothetical protein
MFDAVLIMFASIIMTFLSTIMMFRAIVIISANGLTIFQFVGGKMLEKQNEADGKLNQSGN